MEKLREVFLFIIVFLIFIFDRLIKLYISSQYREEIFLIPKILSLDFYKNYGAAFGLRIPIFLVIVSSIIMIILITFFIRKDFQKKIPYWILLFLILGASSNLFDRIYYGYVIDYYSFFNYSFFNLADGMIVVGLVGVFWCYNRGMIK